MATDARPLEELVAERAYLLARAQSAGRFGLGSAAGPRDFGVSSNAMVEVVLAGGEPSDVAPEAFPIDPSDLAACWRACRRAPAHLQPTMKAILARFREAVGEDYPEVLEDDFWDRVPTCEEGPDAYRESREACVIDLKGLEEDERARRMRLEREVDFLLERARQAGVVGTHGPPRHGRASNAVVRYAFTGEVPPESAWPDTPQELRACMYTVRDAPAARREVMAVLVEAQRGRMAETHPEVQDEDFLARDPNRGRRGMPVDEFVARLERKMDDGPPDDGRGRNR